MAYILSAPPHVQVGVRLGGGRYIYCGIYILSAPAHVQVGVRLGGSGGRYIYCGVYIVCASSCTGGCPAGWGVTLGGHFWEYCPIALSLSQITETHFRPHLWKCWNLGVCNPKPHPSIFYAENWDRRYFYIIPSRVETCEFSSINLWLVCVSAGTASFVLLSILNYCEEI